MIQQCCRKVSIDQALSSRFMLAQEAEDAGTGSGFWHRPMPVCGLPVLLRYGDAFIGGERGFEPFRICCYMDEFEQSGKGDRTVKITSQDTAFEEGENPLVRWRTWPSSMWRARRPRLPARNALRRFGPGEEA